MVEANITFSKTSVDGYSGDVTENEFDATVRSRRYDVFNRDDLKHALNQIQVDIPLSIDKMAAAESGARLRRINDIHIHYDKYKPTRGGSDIATPEWIANKKACVNIKKQ